MNTGLPQPYTSYAKEHSHGVKTKEPVKGVFHYLPQSVINRLKKASHRKNRSCSQLLRVFTEQGLEHDENVVAPLEEQTLQRMARRDEPLSFYQT